MFNVIKRDGEVAAFQLSKITQAIEKAFQAQEKQYTPVSYTHLTLPTN